MTDKFCIMPWKHLTVGTEGSYKLCCVARNAMTEGGAPMSVYHHSLEHAWNSQYMRDIRRAMLSGKAVPDCEACYKNEASSGQSYRTTVAASMMNQPIEQVRAEAIANDYRVHADPKFLKLELGNLCNLQCRMCGSLLSSQIARDLVHSRWAPVWSFDDVPVATWDGDKAVIGPHPLVGVESAGFACVKTADEQRLYWSDGLSRLELDVDEKTHLECMEIEFNAIGHHGQKLRIAVNGDILAELPATPENTIIKVDLAHRKIDRRLCIEIHCLASTSAVDRRGVAVEEIRLLRRPSAGAELPNRMLYSRLPGKALWEIEDAFIFSEVLANAPHLDRLYITGGEPFLMKGVIEIIDYLIASHNTHITLEFSTNCTKITDEILGKLSKFRKVNLLLSLDGAADTYEYIRFPAKWSIVEKKVRMMQQLPNAWICANPVVQIYNAMQLTDLLRFCDANALDFSLGNLLLVPEQLSVSVMPAAARTIAAERLRQYLEKDCRDLHRDKVKSLSQYLESLPGLPSPQMVRKFMLFTNDLDATRKQKFAQVHRELLHAFQDSGFQWTDECVHASSRYGVVNELAADGRVLN